MSDEVDESIDNLRYSFNISYKEYMKIYKKLSETICDILDTMELDSLELTPFKIRYKHPWFLNDLYKKELLIKKDGKTIINCIIKKDYHTNFINLMNSPLIDYSLLKEIIVALDQLVDYDLVAKMELMG